MASQFDQINVVAPQTDWPWKQALCHIFRPSGANLVVAENFPDFCDTIRSKRIHAAILDTDWPAANVSATIKIIRTDFPLLPLILFSKIAEQPILDLALSFDVFSVIQKPVDLKILTEQLNRLFIRKYDCNIFQSLLSNC